MNGSTKNERLKRLADAGVSIWLDDLSRQRITSGNLATLIDTMSVTGVTTNPTIFAAALAQQDAYAAQVDELAGQPVADVIRAITTKDVADACSVFDPVFRASGGHDGRVSIEVEPGLAMDADATTAQAQQLHDMVGRDNVLIKIPATKPGLSAITATIAAGISVNVTLIFGVERYREVMDAYLAGLEAAGQAGRDLSQIHSVASFFVSRVDAEIDKRLDAMGSPQAKALHGKAAIANARLAYQAYAEVFSSPRFAALAAKGANVQRPLWASTGVKNPAYPDTMYVTGLVVADTVNTMPEKTLNAFADHGEVEGDQVSGYGEQASAVFAQLDDVGIDMDDVLATLEKEGVDKFVVSWNELVSSVTEALAKGPGHAQ